MEFYLEDTVHWQVAVINPSARCWFPIASVNAFMLPPSHFIEPGMKLTWPTFTRHSQGTTMPEPPTKEHFVEQPRYGLGVILVVVGGVFLSTNGLMLRLIEHADGWQILFFRGLAFSATLFVILVFKYRRDTIKAFGDIGRRGLLVGLALGITSCFYIFALLLTTVANAMFIIGSAPLATAFGAWLVLGERTSPVGLITMMGALSGVGLLFADGFVAGHWLGNLAALCVVVGFVVYLLTVRGSPNTDMLPAICLSGLVMTMVGFIGADHLMVETRDLLLMLTMGCVQFSVGFMCYTLAARHILASEVAFFALSESILAPLWVWIGVGETPSSLALIGIAIVLVFVTLYGVIEIVRERRSGDGSTSAGFSNSQSS